MFTLSDFKDVIEQQLFHNRNKSLFYEMANGRLILNPSKETTQLLTQKAQEISKFIEATKEDGTYKQLLRYISDKCIKLFMEVNQYLDFSREDYRKLYHIYDDTFKQVCVIAHQEKILRRELNNLFTLHYQNLQTFLLESNGAEIFKKYRETPDLLEIKCAEYTPEFQTSLLKLDVEAIKQPLLDLGCGSQGSLVNFLRENGIEAFGMDRSVDSLDYLFKMNWLDCSFTSNTWGTVISHMAFSNHFTHHHLKTDGNFELYAHKYMEILNSLKVGGSFIYAPSIPFIEELLIASNTSFIVHTKEHSTKVLRIV
ncbi:class I SAM-dependent methyltransferase [Metabacillus fastidiosus]|uniref:class I SAM-dependent methyltransferase n=1 Tax=Metabacillus fastidiosus TaxID=1458 RepID=UPI002DBC6FE3|nr:class I SAM-dependent methyltransferase [Metabacillus fastidiosus]MEC2074860.1 class I SAM-dependent methyltransferase [Metabacillus fastidiosus]